MFSLQLSKISFFGELASMRQAWKIQPLPPQFGILWQKQILQEEYFIHSFAQS